MYLDKQGGVEFEAALFFAERNGPFQLGEAIDVCSIVICTVD